MPNNICMQQSPSSICNLLPLVFQNGLELKDNICVNCQWHTERCPPNFVLQCFTLQKTIRFKCKARINLYKSVSETPAPRYSSLWVEYCSGTLEHYKHWFCPNDLTCCVGGTTRKFAIVRLAILTIWPIQEDINLTQKEVTT